MKNNEEKKSPSVNISWYPGHMTKTKKQIIEDLRLIDVVIEILDARIPNSSRNPDLEKLFQEKERMIILNKSDLADENLTREWKQYWEEKGITAVIVDSNTGKGISEVIFELEKRKEEQRKAVESKGRVGKIIRTMIVGIPNVGKSSFINRLSKKSSAQVGNRPGVTKQKQWVRVNQDIELLDTPGVLWPKLEQEETALNLSYTGTIKDEILPMIEIGYALVKRLREEYTILLMQRYRLDADFLKKIEDQDWEENEKVIEVMKEIGRKRGAIVSGGEVDLDKVANLVVDDFRKGKIGRITLEKPKK